MSKAVGRVLGILKEHGLDSYLVRKKMKAADAVIKARDAGEKEDTGWRTTETGKHYHIGENGEVDKGPAAMVGSNVNKPSTWNKSGGGWGTNNPKGFMAKRSASTQSKVSPDNPFKRDIEEAIPKSSTEELRKQLRMANDPSAGKLEDIYGEQHAKEFKKALREEIKRREQEEKNTGNAPKKVPSLEDVEEADIGAVVTFNDGSSWYNGGWHVGKYYNPENDKEMTPKQIHKKMAEEGKSFDEPNSSGPSGDRQDLTGSSSEKAVEILTKAPDGTKVYTDNGAWKIEAVKKNGEWQVEAWDGRYDKKFTTVEHSKIDNDEWFDYIDESVAFEMEKPTENAEAEKSGEKKKAEAMARTPSQAAEAWNGNGGGPTVNPNLADYALKDFEEAPVGSKLVYKGDPNGRWGDYIYEKQADGSWKCNDDGSPDKDSEGVLNFYFSNAAINRDWGELLKPGEKSSGRIGVSNDLDDLNNAPVGSTLEPIYNPEAGKNEIWKKVDENMWESNIPDKDGNTRVPSTAFPDMFDFDNEVRIYAPKENASVKAGTGSLYDETDRMKGTTPSEVAKEWNGNGKGPQVDPKKVEYVDKDFEDAPTGSKLQYENGWSMTKQADGTWAFDDPAMEGEENVPSYAMCSTAYLSNAAINGEYGKLVKPTGTSGKSYSAREVDRMDATARKEWLKNAPVGTKITVEAKGIGGMVEKVTLVKGEPNYQGREWSVEGDKGFRGEFYFDERYPKDSDIAFSGVKIKDIKTPDGKEGNQNTPSIENAISSIPLNNDPASATSVQLGSTSETNSISTENKKKIDKAFFGRPGFDDRASDMKALQESCQSAWEENESVIKEIEQELEKRVDDPELEKEYDEAIRDKRKMERAYSEVFGTDPYNYQSKRISEQMKEYESSAKKDDTPVSFTKNGKEDREAIATIGWYYGMSPNEVKAHNWTVSDIEKAKQYAKLKKVDVNREYDWY